MFLFDVFIRFTGLGFLLIMILALLIQKKFTPSYFFLLFSCFSLFCLLLGFSPEYIQLPSNVRFIVRLFDIPHLVFIWLFALSLFQHSFRLKVYHALIIIGYCLPILVVRLGQFGFLPEAHYFWFLFSSLFSIGLMIHLITVTLYGKKDDLVEKRRRARNYFVVLIGFITIGVAISEILLVKDNLNLLYTIKAMIIWVGILWAALWLLKLNESPFSDAINKANHIDLTQRDQQLIERLEEQFTEHKIYLDAKLTPELLAQKVGLPTYKLRELINKKLGHQNFSSYVNSYRIEAVKRLLKNPSKRDIPILSLALESGFSSLSPFNKAFKSNEGITPSEFRKNISY